MIARILVIAGSDSGGGAGIQADIKTITMLGGHAMTAITAVTAQNSLGVDAVHTVPTAMVLAQIDAVVADFGVDAVKIGMIGSLDTLDAVADRLGRRDMAGVPVVLDPVMIATSGAVLADAATVAAFGRLMARATVTTPNRDELAALGGIDAVLASGSACLEKGGHDAGATVIDRLHGASEAEPIPLVWEAPRIDTPHSHGTGCTLASAVACGLGQGMPLAAAVARARDVVRVALHGAPGLGRGSGPMGHDAIRNEGVFTGPAINQMTLPAADYAASVAFYRLLGLRQIVDHPAGGYARFEAANGVTVSIEVDAGRNADAGADGSVLFLESGALDGWYAHLARKGVRFDHRPADQTWGWREARLRDPAGNRLCLYQAAEYRRFPPWRLGRPERAPA